MLGAGAQVQEGGVKSKEAYGLSSKIAYLCGLNRFPRVLW
jgi:hypothetical protein